MQVNLSFVRRVKSACVFIAPEKGLTLPNHLENPALTVFPGIETQTCH